VDDTNTCTRTFEFAAPRPSSNVTLHVPAVVPGLTEKELPDDGDTVQMLWLSEDDVKLPAKLFSLTASTSEGPPTYSSPMLVGVANGW
jgi:hypothetical protein